VREHWDGRQPLTSTQLRDNWRSYVQGRWGYYQHCEDRTPIYRKEGWVRRHMRKCYWQRWHNSAGRANKLRELGAGPEHQRTATNARGAWRMAASPAMHKALDKETLRKLEHKVPSDMDTLTQILLN
jgi:hypothetical protein